MIIPVRCPTCGKPIADKWEEYKDRAVEGDEDSEEVLGDLGLDRYCCRTVLITHVDLLEEISQYKQT